MKVSIITATLNNRDTIEQSIRSLYGQTYDNIEHIIIDGGSSDGTLEVIRKYQDKISRWESGYDNGIYYALNKGINLATGDVIGFLHADDFYAHDKVIETVVSGVIMHKVDSCYGDLLYVNRDNTERIVRYWKSSPYEDGLFQRGWMPPHPTFFVKKDIYNKYGLFNTDFKIAADYELMLRFLDKHRITTCYIPEVFVKMRAGGDSNRNLKNIINKTIEDYRAARINGMNNCFYTVLLKNISKVPQFFKR